MIYCAIDLETTGLNVHHDRIISLGAVRFDLTWGEFRLLASVYSIIWTDRNIGEDATAINGLSQQDVSFGQNLLNWVGTINTITDGAICIAHNARFDQAILSNELKRLGYGPLTCKWEDTLLLARQKLSLPHYDLNSVAQYFNIPIEHHNSLSDANATAQIYRQLIS